MIRPTVKFIMEGVGTFVVLAALAFAALAWRLSSGPISLAFLTPYVQSALMPGREGRFHVEIEDTVLAWAGWERTLDIRVLNAAVYGEDGVRVASLPEIAVGISPAGLLRGVIAPTSLDILSPRLRLVRRIDGSFGVEPQTDEALEETVNEEGLTEFLRDVAAGFLTPPNPSLAIGYLRRINISDGDLVVWDEKDGSTWRVPKLSFDVMRDSLGVSGQAAGSIAIRETISTFQAIGQHDLAEGTGAYQISFDGLALDELAEMAEALAPLGGVRAPLSGVIRFDVSADGRIPSVSFDITAGAGAIERPDLFEEPIPIDRAYAQGVYRRDRKELAIDNVYVRSGDATFDADGLVAFTEEGVEAKMFGTILDLPARELPRFWPYDVSGSTRNWIAENIRDGVFTDAQVVIDIEPGRKEGERLPDDAFELTFAFKGLSARYMRTMPPIVDALGKAKLTPRWLDIAVEEARTAEEVKIRDATMRIEGIGEKGKVRARIEMVAVGPARAALEILDNEPLRFASRFGIATEKVVGQSATRARFELPIRADISLDEVGYAAVSNLEGFGLGGVFAGSEIENGRLRLSVNASGIEGEGRVEIMGAPFDMTWTENFTAPKGEPSSRFILRSSLDEAGRASIGMPMAEAIKGPMDVRFEIVGEGPKTGSGFGTIGLKDADIDLSLIGWRKPKGEPGEARLTFRLNEDEIQVESFSIEGGGLEAAGHVNFGSTKKDDEFQLDYVRLGETNVTGNVRLDKHGGYTITLLGAAIDARPLINQALATGAKIAETAFPPVRFDAGVERLIAHNGVIVKNVTASVIHADNRWQSVQVHGFLADERAIDMTLEKSASLRKLSISSGDAGAVVRGIDMYANARGGTLSIDATVDDRLSERPVTGRLDVDNFTIVRAPGLANLLTVGSLTGIARLLSGEGISFKKLDAPFDYRSGVLRLGESRAVGPALGFTLSGEVDRNKDAIDLKGTIIPAYTINNVISKVPLIGAMLAGGKDEGVFAFTYDVKGPVGAPEIKVNPLSALAPGIIRKIVSGDGGAKDLPLPEEPIVAPVVPPPPQG